MTESDERGTTALILLGCPQVPVQTSVALYCAHGLRRNGIRPIVAGTTAARKLVEIADPERHYVDTFEDLDAVIGELAEKKRDADYCFVFAHNDSGIAYAGTISYLSQARLYVLLFGEHPEEVAAAITFPCEQITAKAVHNPMPLKRKIDEVLQWVVSKQ
ncbi:DUF1890 domain-containing protein [Methanoculleus sp. FWC-SCC1]|uniref:DUF1890 domain-containing protein n=1 Tax=Methanoculleus frigidifontis TaxID=2584085 RepID=A0ABT8MCB7_9EURY|nr:DUF1890 domain-containing protein [Methanoculleus sp. FWC-SCC1]MDN7025568.1 DUF1890 domain-containing protein [Methanoculleus sp. FWC-SCC1]